ncbi:MAG: FtsX-like permease family protein, partial [Saprospiraceae bacterium]
EKQFKADERFQKVFGILTVFAILIACLGLFGLASFSVAKRTKEIGIRKVIGASTSNLLITLSKDFIKTVLTSMVIGIPVTYFIIKTWLNDFANRIEISWWLFALPVLVVMILVLLSIAGKTLKTAWMNPVKCLRSE